MIEMESYLNNLCKTLGILTMTATLVLSGCVSTPQSRAEENPDLFDSFTEQQKEVILKGEVDLDFTKEMVMMAAGMPDRKAKRRSSKGSSEVWTYYKYTPRSIYGFGGYGRFFSYSPYYGGYYRNGYWGDHIVVTREGERDKNLEVEFQGGLVVAFEMVQ